MDEVWYSQLPDTAMVDIGGQQMPLRDQPFIKESTDLEAFVRRALDSHSEVGRRVPLKASTPEELANWKNTNLPKLYDAGILERPPGSPSDYAIAKPDIMPEGIAWNDDLATRFAGALHKHGAPKALATELLQLYGEALGGTQKQLETDYDTALTALKKEHGEHYEVRKEEAKRLTPLIFKTPEELAFFEELGIGDHPAFLSVMMRLAPLAAQDSSYLKDALLTTGVSPDDVRSELARIMTDKTHPMHAGYHQRDAKVLAHITDMYKKAYPGTTEI